MEGKEEGRKKKRMDGRKKRYFKNGSGHFSLPPQTYTHTHPLHKLFKNVRIKEQILSRHTKMPKSH